MYARGTAGIFLRAHLCSLCRSPGRAAASLAAILLALCAAPAVALGAAEGLRAPDARREHVLPPPAPAVVR